MSRNRSVKVRENDWCRTEYFLTLGRVFERHCGFGKSDIYTEWERSSISVDTFNRMPNYQFGGGFPETDDCDVIEDEIEDEIPVED